MNQTKPIILQFDDDEGYHAVVDLICFNMGLEIAAKAKDINTSRNLVSQIESGKLNPDIAVISSYLGNDHQDGGKLAKKLRELVPTIKVIAFTHIPDESWGDRIAIKSGKDQTHTLIQALEELTGHEFKASNVGEVER